MTKRFIVIVDNPAASPSLYEKQSERFIGYAKGKGFGWGSWFSQCWLAVDPFGKMTAEQLTDDVRDIFGGHCLVFELREGEGTWAGRGPKEMFEWVHSNWGKGFDLRAALGALVRNGGSLPDKGGDLQKTLERIARGFDSPSGKVKVEDVVKAGLENAGLPPDNPR